MTRIPGPWNALQQAFLTVSATGNDMCHDAHVLPYTAYLRIYQPVDAFSPHERRRWEEYAASHDRPRRINALAAEHSESLGRLLTFPPRAAPSEESENAYLRRVNERLYVCPWQTRLRSWRAFEKFVNSTPRPVSEAFVSGAETRRTVRKYQEWRDSGARVRPGILSSNWMIPVPWFVPFEANERCLVLSADSTRTLLYLTRVSLARRRLEHTLAVLRERSGRRNMSVSTQRLEEWLTDTAHPDALLELDYGGLPYLLSDDHLYEDHSVADVSAVVAALSAGRTDQVGDVRRRLLRRWRSVRALERAN